MSDDQRWHAFEWFNGEPCAGDFWVTHAMNVARQTHDLAFKAVNAWAEQMQMTPDEWLKRWAPVAEHKYEENDCGGLELKIVIRATARDSAT